ncbi:hypothetical protein EBR03_00250 [bacterium]|nr:hypothetical protein [bacterium]
MRITTKRYGLTFGVLIAFSVLSASCPAREIQLNQITVFEAPEWLKTSAVQAVVDRVQNYLEWDFRKLSVFYYKDLTEFNRQHTFKFAVDAFFRKSDSSIHLSPKVIATNFSQIMSHELVHALFYQKYQKAIPVWLEEGLANTIAQLPSPNYQWLKTQSWPSVATLGHSSHQVVDSKVYYSVSTGVIEMIREKCNLHELLKLAVGSQLTSYLKTFCGIEDLDLDFKSWVAKKADSQWGDTRSDLPWWKKKQLKKSLKPNSPVNE